MVKPVLISNKAVEEIKTGAKKLTQSVATSLVMAGVALLVAAVALIVSLVK